MGLTTVELVNAALSDGDGESTLSIDPLTPGNLGQSLFDVPNLKGRQTIQTRRLSPFIERPVDLLKLDIEGLENQVIDKLAESRKLNLVDQIVMEYHHHMQPPDDQLGSMLVTLQDHGFGYQIVSKPPLPFRKHDPALMFVYAYTSRTAPPLQSRSGSATITCTPRPKSVGLDRLPVYRPESLAKYGWVPYPSTQWHRALPFLVGFVDSLTHMFPSSLPIMGDVSERLSTLPPRRRSYQGA